MPVSPKVYPAGAVRKYRARLTSRDGTDLTATTVELSLTPQSTGTPTWQAADWTSGAGRTRNVRTTAAYTLTAGSYWLEARLGGAGGETFRADQPITVS